MPMARFYRNVQQQSQQSMKWRGVVALDLNVAKYHNQQRQTAMALNKWVKK